MKIHYFQRYHGKENVATANTMLLLSRLYSYSSDKFFAFMKAELFDSEFEPEITFKLQEKSVSSIPDATIVQESFKIVVETKMSDWFHSDQLMNHLESFSDEKYKVLLTIAPEFMADDKKREFGELTDERKDIIKKAIEDGDEHGYDLHKNEHRYFFVEKFYETDFSKNTPRAPMGSRIFDLTQILKTNDIPNVETIAELLKNETWS